MRTDPSHSPDPPPTRLRQRVGQLRRWLDARGGASRWGLGTLVALSLIVAAVGYSLSTSAETGAWEPLYGGRKLSAVEVERISAALATAKVPYDFDAKGSVIVPAGRQGEARALLVKQKTNPRELQDVLNEMGQSSSWIDGPAERELRIHRLQEEALELMIRELPAIESASVMVSRPKTRQAASRGEPRTAVVYLRIEKDSEVPQATIHAIRNLVIAGELDVRPESLTIQDTNGLPYLVKGNTHLGIKAEVRLREEDYSAKIQKRLREITGVRVFVSYDFTPVTDEPLPAITTTPAPVLGVNTPLGEGTPPPPPSHKTASSGKAKVLVHVPIGYYLDIYHSQTKAGHEPALDDLQPLVDKTEEVIRVAVTNTIPSEELDKNDIKISRINVPGEARPTPTVPASSEMRRVSEWTLAVASVGAVVSLGLLILGGRWLANRRPAAGPSRPHGRRPYSHEASVPSERVRDLVRRDPEAAAGVLQRWIGGGGDDA